MQLEERTIISPPGAEFYLTATPDLSADPATEARRIFEAIDEAAAGWGARICRHRVFAPEGCLEAYRHAWQAAAPSGSPCTWLHAGKGAAGGVQAYAVAGPFKWTPLRDARGLLAGWLCQNGKMNWIHAAGLPVPKDSDEAAATSEAFAAAATLLAQGGMALADVARTWFFLDDILRWYGRFNAGRNETFGRHGLLTAAAGVAPPVPASTGIGVAPASDALGAMDLFAVCGQGGCIDRRPAAGRQRSAYEYGSAFARASRAVTPGGHTLFVSGTAAIDERGQTCFLGDVDGQIRMTLDNVQAVLDDTHCHGWTVVEAMAYCKTPAVADAFERRHRGRFAWPWLVAVGDVCRDDLLFEVEITAGLSAAG